MKSSNHRFYSYSSFSRANLSNRIFTIDCDPSASTGEKNNRNVTVFFDAPDILSLALFQLLCFIQAFKFRKPYRNVHPSRISAAGKWYRLSFSIHAEPEAVAFTSPHHSLAPTIWTALAVEFCSCLPPRWLGGLGA